MLKLARHGIVSPMTYTMRETAPLGDYNNSELAASGMYGALTLEEYFSGLPNTAKPVMDQFGELWERVYANLQMPILEDEVQLKGFTGHRITSFEGQMGRFALGFQLSSNSSILHRTIVANRRKVYANNRRRLNYVSDELAVSSSDIVSNPFSRKLQYNLGVLSVWVDKFTAAAE